MKIVLDTNIIMAALMGSRAALIIITSQHYELYAPEGVITEIKRHKNFICRFIKQNTREFNINLHSILEFVHILSIKEYTPYLTKSLELMKDRDSSDAVFIACAFCIKADFIWSNDKDFKEQNLFQTKTTQEFIDSRK